MNLLLSCKSFQLHFDQIKVINFVFFLLLTTIAFSQNNTNSNLVLDKTWQSLLDDDLSYWEKFIGVPHTSVDIDGVEKSENVHVGTPLGVGNDPKNVFSTIKKEKETLLKVTGEIYGGLTTLQQFGNYHLRVKFKWGEQKWEPRLNKKRDNGILYHCHGKHGAFWNVWMSSLECQIQEGDTGDFVTLVKGRADVSSTKIKNDLYKVTGENDSVITYGAGSGNPP